MSLYRKINGFRTLINAETLEMPKDELIEEHEKLTETLGKTAEELEAEKKKQEQELAEYKANDANFHNGQLVYIQGSRVPAVIVDMRGKKALIKITKNGSGLRAGDQVEFDLEDLEPREKLNSDNAIDLDDAARDAREGLGKGVSEENVRALVKQKYKFDDRDDDILSAVMQFAKKQLKTNSQKQIPDDDESIGRDWDAKSPDAKKEILREAFGINEALKHPSLISKKWADFSRAERISIIGAW